MAPLLQTCDGPFLNISEGVFIYLHRNDVKSLVLQFQSRFQGSDLVCYVFNDLWLKRRLKGIVNFEMRKELHREKGATFHLGSGMAGRWRNRIQGSRFLMAGLTLILRNGSLDGSGSYEALDCSERRNGRFITG